MPSAVGINDPENGNGNAWFQHPRSKKIVFGVCLTMVLMGTVVLWGVVARRMVTENVLADMDVFHACDQQAFGRQRRSEDTPLEAYHANVQCLTKQNMSTDVGNVFQLVSIAMDEEQAIRQNNNHELQWSQIEAQNLVKKTAAIQPG